jgi:2-octaprenyl-6-methoxyphenol hydroxylase
MAGQRVALIGEAAHMVPPIGAQGFNLTMRDVLALADVLKDRHDPGDEGILAQYVSRRRSDVMARTTVVDLLNRSLLSDFLPLQFARGMALYAIARFGLLRRAAMRQGLAPGSAG